MLKLWIKVLLLFVIVDLSGCAATSNREYLSVRKSREIDKMFEQKVMVPGYNYYYNGTKTEPIALLGLDPDYTIRRQVMRGGAARPPAMKVESAGSRRAAGGVREAGDGV